MNSIIYSDVETTVILRINTPWPICDNKFLIKADKDA
jgi:hypothetical protein